MAGDLLIKNLSEDHLNVLVPCGAEMGDTLFHADKYAQASWDSLEARLTAAANGDQHNSRAGLPPHFYISFSRSKFNLPEEKKPAFAGIIGAAVRPLTIVAAHAGLNGWSQATDNMARVVIFTKALEQAKITLEVYGYDGEDLIDRNTGEIHESLSYMKRANE